MTLPGANRSDKYVRNIWFVGTSLSLVPMQAALRGECQTKGVEMKDRKVKAALVAKPKQAAEMLAVSPRKLWAMTFEDQPGLPYIRCGRLVRYPIADLERWIESQRQGGADA